MRRHRGLVEVLSLGALIRIAVDLSRGPAVYQDSLVYISLSKNAPFSFSPSRPNGYPVVLRLLSVVSQNLDFVTATQHVAGLAVAALAYFLLIRMGMRRGWATITTALIVLNSLAVALEQDVLSEALFSLTLFASAYLLLATRRRAPELVASGLLLAAAVTMRVVAIFGVPVWIAFVVLLRPSRRATFAALLAMSLPLLAYSTFHAAEGRGFGFTTADGWFLYGKVATIVDCSGAHVPRQTRPLCNAPRGNDEDFYKYDRTSPAQVLFFGPTRPVDVEKAWNSRNSGVLRDFSLAIVRAHPQTFAHIVVRDWARYLGPNRPSGELSLYGKPGSLMLRYERWFRLPYWTITGAVVAAVLAVLLGRADRGRAREISFLIGMPLVLLLGTSATGPFNVRYLVPLVPLVLCAGALGINSIVTDVRRHPDAQGPDSRL